MSSWRDYVSVHPAADLLPLLSADELAKVADDIDEHGLREKVKVVERISKRPDGTVIRYQVIDGRNRLDAFELKGAGDLLFKSRSSRSGAQFHDDIAEVVDLESDDAITAYVISANIHRRHLTREQNRDLIGKLLKATPEKSNRQIAKMVGASHPHIGKVRAELESTGDVETVTTSIDTKGRKQPIKKKRRDVDDYLADLPPAPKPEPPKLSVTVTESPEISIDDRKDALDDPLVLDRDDEIEATPWFSSKIKPIFDGSVKNDEVKSALALAGFKLACATFLPQSTIKDLEAAQNIFGVISELKYEVEDAKAEAKRVAADAKRIKWEASHPEQAKNKAREQAQSDAMECDREDAKAEARENGERWGDVKEDWIEEWIADNWGAKEEAEFEKNFQEQWVREHNTPAESDPPAETNTQHADKAKAEALG